MRIAFFSYKGGVGRSLVLASTAAAFAGAYGGRVGLLDADIEAPSLHFLFNVRPDADQNFVDILVTGTVGGSLIHERVLTLGEGLLGDRAKKLGGGSLFLFPSLPDKPSEKKVSKVTCDAETQDVCEDFLDAFVTAEGLDHVFIDCRTGFSVMASMMLTLADAVVLVFRIDRQNLHGVQTIIERTERRRKGLLLVANMLPLSPRATRKLGEFQESIGRRIDVVIPYDERLVFGDVIAPLDCDASDEISQAFRSVAEKIFKGEYRKGEYR